METPKKDAQDEIQTETEPVAAAAVTPPISPKHLPVEPKIERSSDELSTSIVRSLYFVDTFLIGGGCCTLCLPF